MKYLSNIYSEMERLNINNKRIYFLRQIIYRIKKILFSFKYSTDAKKQKKLEKKLFLERPLGVILCLHYIGNHVKIRSLSIDNYFKLISKYKEYFKPLDKINEGGVFLTFDDGFLNQYEYAFKYLKQYNIPSTIFVSADNINQPGYMNPNLLYEVANTDGYFIGAHAFNHRPIKYSSHGDVRFQFSETKKRIESATKCDCLFFAYPWGGLPHTSYYSRKYAKKSGFLNVFSTIKAPFTKSSINDGYYIPRIAVTDDNFEDVIKIINDYLEVKKSYAKEKI